MGPQELLEQRFFPHVGKNVVVVNDVTNSVRVGKLIKFADYLYVDFGNAKKMFILLLNHNQIFLEEDYASR